MPPCWSQLPSGPVPFSGVETGTSRCMLGPGPCFSVSLAVLGVLSGSGRGACLRPVSHENGGGRVCVHTRGFFWGPPWLSGQRWRVPATLCCGDTSQAQRKEAAHRGSSRGRGLVQSRPRVSSRVRRVWGTQTQGFFLFFTALPRLCLLPVSTPVRSGAFRALGWRRRASSCSQSVAGLACAAPRSQASPRPGRQEACGDMGGLSALLTQAAATRRPTASPSVPPGGSGAEYSAPGSELEFEIAHLLPGALCEQLRPGQGWRRHRVAT